MGWHRSKSSRGPVKVAGASGSRGGKETTPSPLEASQIETDTVGGNQQLFINERKIAAAELTIGIMLGRNQNRIDVAISQIGEPELQRRCARVARIMQIVSTQNRSMDEVKGIQVFQEVVGGKKTGREHLVPIYKRPASSNK